MIFYRRASQEKWELLCRLSHLYCPIAGETNRSNNLLLVASLEYYSLATIGFIARIAIPRVRSPRNYWQDIDNLAVQLQGPFIRRELAPPPAHRNVVMIAAGTGINPSKRVCDVVPCFQAWIKSSV